MFNTRNAHQQVENWNGATACVHEKITTTYVAQYKIHYNYEQQLPPFEKNKLTQKSAPTACLMNNVHVIGA